VNLELNAAINKGNDIVVEPESTNYNLNVSFAGRNYNSQYNNCTISIIESLEIIYNTKAGNILRCRRRQEMKTDSEKNRWVECDVYMLKCCCDNR
jgi:hypothetical protein